MNFQPTDYLSNLNLDFDSMSPIEGTTTSNDLDLFSQSDFFDLDVFSNDIVAPSKEQQLKKQVKQEELEASLLAQMMTPQTPLQAEGPQEVELSEAKRKRNTAASARFRIKKKQKEKQMEEHANMLQDRLSGLEKKLKTLEMENRYLRQLILEKNEKRNDDLLESIKKRSLADLEVFSFTN